MRKLKSIGGVTLLAVGVIVFFRWASSKTERSHISAPPCAESRQPPIAPVVEKPTGTGTSFANRPKPKDLDPECKKRIAELVACLKNTDADKRPIEWILAAQKSDGHWQANVGIDAPDDVMVTILASLAILHSRGVPSAGAMWRSLERSVKWLTIHRNAEGSLDSDAITSALLVILFSNCMNGRPQEQGWRSESYFGLRSMLADTSNRMCKLQRSDGSWPGKDSETESTFATVCSNLALGYSRSFQSNPPPESHLSEGPVWKIPDEVVDRSGAWNDRQYAELFSNDGVPLRKGMHDFWRRQVGVLCGDAASNSRKAAVVKTLEALLRDEPTANLVVSPNDYDLLAVLSKWSLIQHSEDLNRYVDLQRNMYDVVKSQMNKSGYWDPPEQKQEGFDGIVARGSIGQTALACMILAGYQDALWSQIQRFQFGMGAE
jgi:hypothetical protein